MTFTTFSSGVNTNFSSELNDNFTEVNTMFQQKTVAKGILELGL